MDVCYLCGATQMGLTEQLLYLSICLNICKDRGQSWGPNHVSNGMGTIIYTAAI